MPKSREQKAEEIKKLNDIADKKAVVFVNFHGVPVSDTWKMRGKLRASDIGYFVSKKTLIKKAFGEKQLKGEMPKLDGEIALAYGDDETAPAREVFSFQKQFEDRVSIVGGIFQGAFVSKEEMENIAKIPSMNTLRGMFVNVINSPIQGFVLALNAIASKKQA